jgi:tetraacyldisaccharide 4'-kinase
MPAGPLRAPLDFQLALAGAIVVNKAAPEAGDRVAEWLRHRFKGPVLRCTTVATGDADRLRGQRVVAWAGIGAPHRFFGMLEALGAELAERVAFRDHQRLGEADAGRLLDLARRHGARLLTTEKDLVRLTGATGLCAELAKTAEAVPIRLSFAEPDGERLAVMIDDAVRGA